MPEKFFGLQFLKVQSGVVFSSYYNTVPFSVEGKERRNYMAFLIPDSTYTIKAGAEERKVNVKIIPDGARADKNIASYIKKGDLVKPNKKLDDGSGKPRGITIHNTNDITVAKGTNAAEQYARATYPNGNMNGVVVHYYVWENDIWQILSDSERGWHAADGSSRKAAHINGKTVGGNVDTIAIEIIQSKRNEKTEKTAALLTAYLLAKHGLSPETDIYTHNYFYPKKYCPVVLLPVWDEFTGRIKDFYKQIKSPEEKPTPEKPVEPSKAPELGNIVAFLGGEVFISSDAKTSNAKAAAGNAKITAVAKGNAHPYHLRAVDAKGVFSSGVYGWVNASAIKTGDKKPEGKPVNPTVSAGDKVEISKSAERYFPNGIKIPSWVKTDYYHIVSQVSYRGSKVYKGGEECVLLGKKADKKTGKISGGINTWISIKNIKKI